MFIFEGRGKGERTGHERIAMRNIKWACNNIVGMHYNDIQDNNPEYLPKSYEDLFDEIYDGAMNNLYDEGYEGCGKAPKEMRFAGVEFVKAYINYLLTESDLKYDVEEMKEVAGWVA